MQVLLSVVGIVLFIALILVHEWGHFIVARRNGVTVEEFGLGFPPRAFGRKLKSGMILSLNWLPLGGFVRMKGEHDSDAEPGSYGAASLGVKVRILLAGVFMNLLAGLAILTILALIGLPKLITKDWSGEDQFTVASDTKILRSEVRVGVVQPGSPAASAGLSTRDKLLAINGHQLTDANQVHDLTKSLAGQTIYLSYEHQGKTVDRQTTLLSQSTVEASQKTDQPKGYLGIQTVDLQIRRSTWSAPIVALGFTKQLTWLTLKGLGHAIGGLGSTIAGLVTNNHTARQNGQTEATAQVGGPVAIARILWDSGSLGLNFMLIIIAIISLTLAIMNVLPIPALDGGRLFLTVITRALGRPLSAAREDWVHGFGMLVLLILGVLITIVDVKRYF